LIASELRSAAHARDTAANADTSVQLSHLLSVSELRGAVHARETATETDTAPNSHMALAGSCHCRVIA
jgi:hypothetical protein